MPRYLLSFLFFYFYIFYVMFCFILTSPPLMLCVYLQTFEAALFWKKKFIYETALKTDMGEKAYYILTQQLELRTLVKK